MMKITADNNNLAIMKEIGERVKRSRLDMQLTQKELAQRAGISAASCLLSIASDKYIDDYIEIAEDRLQKR